jgi:hypothetical protein
MSAPDLKKSGTTALNDLIKILNGELTPLWKKWRKTREDIQKVSESISNKFPSASPAEKEKLSALSKKMDAEEVKNREAVLKDRNKWDAATKEAKRMLDELPARITELRKTQAKYQLLVDKLVPGLKEALKKQAIERAKAVEASLKASGLM